MSSMRIEACLPGAFIDRGLTEKALQRPDPLGVIAGAERIGAELAVSAS